MATTKAPLGKRSRASSLASTLQPQKLVPSRPASSSMKNVPSKRPVLRATSRTTLPCPPAPQISNRLFIATAVSAHEFGHGGMLQLADTLAPYDLQQSQPENLKIEAEA